MRAIMTRNPVHGELRVADPRDNSSGGKDTELKIMSQSQTVHLPGGSFKKQGEMALAFYNANYDSLFYGELRPGQRVMIGTKSPRICRFCGRGTPEVTFKSDAHAVSRLTGNNVLLTYDECSSCNDRFSKLEDDLGKFTLPARTFGLVRGYQKIPSLKTRDARMDMNPGSLRIEVDPATLDQIISEDLENHTLTVSVPMQSYRPLGVYKAFVKMAATLLPTSELGQFQEALRWLASEAVEENAVSDGFGSLCIQTFCEKVYKFPIVRLLRRKDTSSAPYATFVLSFGSFTYQIFLAGDFKEARRDDDAARLQAFPPPQLVLGTTAEDWVDVKVLSLSSPEKVTGAVWKHTFKYQTREEPGADH